MIRSVLIRFRAWHAAKYVDPAESGAVIPIVHVNGFKISERTLYGCMDDKEIVSLFTGYGYQVRFVQDLDNIDDDMAASLAWAHAEIKKIQKAAREDKKPIFKPRWPVLILRTPKVRLVLTLDKSKLLIGYTESDSRAGPDRRNIRVKLSRGLSNPIRFPFRMQRHRTTVFLPCKTGYNPTSPAPSLLNPAHRSRTSFP